MDQFRKSIYFTILFLFLCGLGGFSSFAQTSNSFFWEPEFSVSISTETPWSYSFGIADRALLGEYYDGVQVVDLQNEHIELNHYTTYSTGASSAVSLGVRYRFREMFDDSRYDELRFVEQFSYAHPNSGLGLSHRLRTEQRLRNTTTHRFRYRIAGGTDLSDVFSIGLSTEALYSISAEAKPSLEQRFTLGFDNTSFENIELSAGVEYQMGDYNIDLENEFFILTGIALDL